MPSPRTTCTSTRRARMPRAKRKKVQADPQSRGLDARRLAGAAHPAAVDALAARIADDGGSVLGIYRDPLGSHWQILAALPIDAVEPTPFQRDLSDAHVTRLADAIDRLDRYVDPVTAVPGADGRYWTPNGYHRLGAMRRLGAKSIVALVVPEPEVAHRILLLNTEKAHNLRERSLEVIRLAQGLAELDDRPEKEFQTEFEEPSLLTLGLCYQENGRFAGAVYHPVLRKTESFQSARLSQALAVHRKHAAAIMELNGLVEEAVKKLKEKGFDSPYLKAFIMARINPLRFSRKPTADFDETMEKMMTAVRKFDAAKVKPDQVARAGGPPEETG